MQQNANQQNVGTGNSKQQLKPNEERQERIMVRAKGQVKKEQSQTVALQGHHGQSNTIGSSRREQKKHNAAEGLILDASQVFSVSLFQVFCASQFPLVHDQRR
jgi:hypothetical protein